MPGAKNPWHLGTPGTPGTFGTSGTLEPWNLVKSLPLVFLALATLSAATSKRTFTGVITDDMCATKAGHATMRMGSNDAECTLACVDAHGASYVLFDGKTAYKLSDQTKPQQFAGRKVRVVGTLDLKTRTIQVDSITAR